MKRNFSVVVGILVLVIVMAGCSFQQVSSSNDYSAEEIVSAIREAYGEDYLPDTEIPEEMSRETFGIDMTLVDEIKAEMPAIGFHPDRVIIVKAESGKGEVIETALNAAKESMIQESIQYPMNQAKVNACQVVRHGDYVGFLLVGAPDDTSEDDMTAAQFAEEQTAKAVRAFEAFFQ